ncbi:hypothetical protein VHEMI07194 [[Torrubiella] hemipterigena]|uniref:Uncharacterized protein n=1 Tax=[Torrubiella] hemipterigena TaxID=1531966 RepID=A0A0A1TKX3_9HYPO|nr:hypothetical protein VHEMI07194 [[Torrubiella] hemipterigena]
MPRKSLKGENADSSSSPAVKTPKTPKTASATPAKDAKTTASATKATTTATPTPASGTKRPRQSKEKKAAIAADARAAARNPFVDFALAQVLSIAIATGGQYALGEVTGRELTALRSSGDVVRDLGVQTAWRFVSLALAWFANLDSLDAAAMAFMSTAPGTYLLYNFYAVSPLAALGSLAIDVLAAAVPFHLFRPLSNVHSKTPGRLYNRELLTFVSQLHTSAFAVAIYSVTISLALRFYLARVFVMRFAGIPSVELAYSASPISVLPVAAAFGIVASAFLFPSFATTSKTKDDDKIRQFVPADASLKQTVWWNVWGYTTKTKVLIRRAALAVVATSVGTYLSSSMSIRGVEACGSISYAGVWAVATLLTAVGLGVIGSE